MTSFEARYMAAETALRQMSGTNAVLSKQVLTASTLLSDVRSLLEDLSYKLPGGDRKEILQMQRQCENWQRDRDRISIEDPE